VKKSSPQQCQKSKRVAKVMAINLKLWAFYFDFYLFHPRAPHRDSNLIHKIEIDVYLMFIDDSPLKWIFFLFCSLSAAISSFVFIASDVEGILYAHILDRGINK
jgi:uncharacterized membrane protein